jgi:hypothetical protein
MELVWHPARVELVDGYDLLDAQGHRTATVDASIAVQGGFLHVSVPGVRHVQVVSAPAVRLVSYQPKAT